MDLKVHRVARGMSQLANQLIEVPRKLLSISMLITQQTVKKNYSSPKSAKLLHSSWTSEQFGNLSTPRPVIFPVMFPFYGPR